jgi:hypothetical protein
MKILIQCAWCRKNLGEKESSGLQTTAPLISHSICPACYVRFSDDIRTDTNCPDAEQWLHFRTLR